MLQGKRMVARANFTVKPPPRRQRTVTERKIKHGVRFSMSPTAITCRRCPYTPSAVGTLVAHLVWVLKLTLEENQVRNKILTGMAMLALAAFGTACSTETANTNV